MCVYVCGSVWSNVELHDQCGHADGDRSLVELGWGSTQFGGHFWTEGILVPYYTNLKTNLLIPNPSFRAFSDFIHGHGLSEPLPNFNHKIQ